MEKSIINTLLEHNKYVDIDIDIDEFIELLNELIQIAIKENKDKFKILLNANNIINFSMVMLDLDLDKMCQFKCAENVDNLQKLFLKITRKKLENVDRIILTADFDEYDDDDDVNNDISLQFIFVDNIIENYFDILEKVFYNHAEYFYAFIPDNVSHDIFEYLCLYVTRKVLGRFVYTIAFYILCLCNYFDQF